jgi:hypothetical protein
MWAGAIMRVSRAQWRTYGLRALAPMQLKLRDRLGDASGEVIGRPYVTTGGKDVHVRVQRVDNPDVTMVRSWGAHERVAVRRA